MGILKWIRFFLHVIKYGSLLGKPIDFDFHRNELIKSLPIDHPKKLAYQKIRGSLAQTRVLGPLIGNIAYIKNAYRVNRNFFFVDSLKLGYVRILKSASTSVLRELLPRMDGRLSQNQLTDQQVDQLGTNYCFHNVSQEREGYSFFTIVRNPFHRLVSVYQDIFNRDGRGFTFGFYLFGILKSDMSFKEFVKVVSLIPDVLKEPHFIPQVMIISECGGLSKIRFFILEKDGDAIQDFMLSQGFTFGHSNRGPNYSYQDFYDIETVNLAYSIYERDVVELGYQDEYHALLRYVKG